MGNIVRLFLAQAATNSDAVAIIDRANRSDRSTTFGELDERAARIATLLARRGIGIGSPVLLFHPPSAELYAVLVAIFRLGAIAMVVDVSAGRQTLDSACEAMPPAALFASGPGLLFALTRRALRAIGVRLTSARFAPACVTLASAKRLPRSEHVAPVAGSAPALVTFTSGSTGAAKGAVRSHDVLAAQHHALGSVAARRGDVDLVSLPVVVLTNLASGATSVIPDGDIRHPGTIDPAPILGQVARARVTRVTTSPALVERLVAHHDARSTLGSVRIVTGGGPVFPDLIERATATTGAELVAVYGSTEAEPIAHLSSAAIGADEIAAMRSGAGLLAGHPVPETSVCIVPTGTRDAMQLDALLSGRSPSKPRTRGEILVCGRHVVPGYLHGRGDAETKVRVGGDVWHRTGDAGYLDERGRLWLLGRMRGTIADARGELHPFAVETAARLIIPVRRSVLAAHRGRRILLVEGVLDQPDRALLADGLRWAALDRLVGDVEIPLDRRHNSKVNYAALARLLERIDPPNAR